MKCLSLTQPWATLVAIGAKRIETRSWATGYRGPLAIHASKGFPRWASDTCFEEPFHRALIRASFIDVRDLPLGAVVATCRLFTCRLIVERLEHLGPCADTNRMLPPPEPERSFGDYAPGRYAWILEDVKMLPKPIPAKGALGLWEWEPPALTDKTEQPQKREANQKDVVRAGSVG